MNDEKINKFDDQLMCVLKSALIELESRGEIVLCSSAPSVPAKFLYDELQRLMPSGSLSTPELTGLRSLIVQAINDKRFFDWEMPTLTGLKAEEFAKIAEKLPKG